MRFPSVAALSERAKAVLLRFPWPLACGVVAAVAAIVSLDDQGEDFWPRLCMVAALGIPLTLALTLLAERRGWRGTGKTALLAAGVLGLVWFLLTWPGPEQKHLVIRYVQLSIALHLLVAFLPFWGVPEGRGFWQYNRSLFEGFLKAVLFSGVLFVGLAIALGALDKLFGVDVEGETYIRLWFLLAFVVNTGIFLGGVPDDLEMREAADDYPRALKVFTQYILTPLVAVYLVILIAYLVKILGTGSWPSGWIGYLVSSVAVTGILGFLLVHPLRTSEKEAWIRTYARWLYVGLIPAAVMFLLALWKRVDPYGLTELRILGILLGVWLLGIALLYTVRRETGIRIIPVSLAAILLFTAFGPLSTTSLSVRSQASRLRSRLEASGLLGQERRDVAPVSSEDRKQMSESLRFLLERNAIGTVKDVFGARVEPLDPLPPHRADLVDSTAKKILAIVGIEYMLRYDYEPADYFAVEPQETGAALPISGFDYVIALNGSDSTTASLAADTVTITFDTAAMALRVRRHADTLLSFPFAPLVNTLTGLEPSVRATVPLRLAQESDSLRGMLRLAWLSGERKNGRLRVTAWRGDLYVGRRMVGP